MSLKDFPEARMSQASEKPNFKRKKNDRNENLAL